MTARSDPIAEIRRLYYAATKHTIVRDLERAVELLVTVGSEEERERAAVFMDGMSQMRSEWGVSQAAPRATSPRASRGHGKPAARKQR